MASWNFKYVGIKPDGGQDENVKAQMIKVMECLGFKRVTELHYPEAGEMQVYSNSTDMWFDAENPNFTFDTNFSGENYAYSGSGVDSLANLFNDMFGDTVVYYQHEDGNNTSDYYARIEETLTSDDDSDYLSFSIAVCNYCKGDNTAFNKRVVGRSIYDAGVKYLEKVISKGQDYQKYFTDINKAAKEKGYDDIAEMFNEVNTDITKLEYSSYLKSITFRGVGIFIPKDFEKTDEYKLNGSVLEGLHNLERYRVDPENEFYCDIDGVLYSKDKKTLISVPQKYQGEFTVPDTVEAIGESAFYNCKSITKINIPDSVKTVGNNAFVFVKCFTGEWVVIGGSLIKYNGSDPTPVIPEGVTSIDYSAFSNNKTLVSVNIPNGVTRLGESAFSYCENLESITLPETLTEIDENAFYSCKSLKELVLPESVKVIGREAFSHCESLESINIPDGVEKIEDYTFFSCHSLETLVLPDSVKQLDWNFYSGVKYISIPSDIESISGRAFDIYFRELTCRGYGTFTHEKDISTMLDIAYRMIREKDFSFKLPGKIKYPFIAGFYKRTEDADAEAFIKKNFARVMKQQIDNGDIDFVNLIISKGNFITKKNIDKFIAFADESFQSEISDLLSSLSL